MTNPAAAVNELHLSEQLTHSTVRLEALDANGASHSGTGFFYNFAYGAEHVPAIVTNRHVLSGMSLATLHLTHKAQTGEPIYGRHDTFVIPELQSRCIYHPNPSVDLAILFFGEADETMRLRGTPIYYKALTRDHLPTDNMIESFTAFEEIVMVGYPSGLWDSFNNLPLMRRGHTATPLAREYLGRPEFLVDAAVFPGSSGSPIYIYNDRGYAIKQNAIRGGVRFALVGIVYAVHVYSAVGEIIAETVPTETRPVPVSRLPLHLGICLKSRLILDFEPLVEQHVLEFKRTGKHPTK